jgi:hypothetical protein
MLGRVRQRKDHRPVVDTRHALDDLLGERTTDGADADDGGRPDAFDGGDEVPGRCMPVCIRLLEIDQVCARRLQQSVDIEHVDPGLRILGGHALRNKRRTQQVRKANARRTGAEEQVLFVPQSGALEPGGVDHAGERDARRALHVVVIDAEFVTIALQQMHCVHPGPILEMDAAFREHLLHRFDKLVDKGVEFAGRRAGLAHSEIERIVQVLFIVGAGIEIHREQILRRHARASRVQLQFSDRNAGPVGTKVAETENAAAIRDANKPDVLLRPVLQDFLDLAFPCHREVHAALLAIDVAELETGFANRRVIDDRQKAGRIGHHRPIEQLLVVVEQVYEIDITVDIAVFVTQLHHHTT